MDIDMNGIGKLEIGIIQSNINGMQYFMFDISISIGIDS
jgi:hypothetical protein